MSMASSEETSTSASAQRRLPTQYSEKNIAMVEHCATSALAQLHTVRCICVT